MRQDKLTTKFTEALSDAQSLALGNDNAYIEPVHLLAAMLRQEDGPRALLERAGVNVPGLSAAAENAIKRLPQVQGGEMVQVGPDLAKLLQARLIELTLPDKPNSRLQQYRLTEQGRDLLK